MSEPQPARRAGARPSRVVERANLAVPTSTAVGSYDLIACADDLKRAAEGNEKHNCKASATRVTVQ